MINSIQQFQKNGIGKIEKVTSKFYENPSNIAEYVKGITENIVELGLSLIKEGFEDIDEYIRKNSHRRKNWVIVRKSEHPSGGKKRLINAKYFSGVYKGRDGNERLWKEVSEYIKFNYDVDKIKRIFINGDGASWIKAGTKYIEKSTFVIDKFHLNKYINQLCASLDEGKIEGEIPGDITKQFESGKKFLLRNFKYIKNGIYC